MIAGRVSAGTTAAINSASLIEISNAGAFIRQQIYGPFVAGFNVRGEGVTNWRPWGGYAMGGITDDIGAGGNDIYFVKTYTDFMSGCRERKVEPPTQPVVLTVKTPGIQVATNDLWIPITVPVNDITMLTTTACFKKRCVGDLNGDGLVDDDDFVIFAAAYNALICPTNPGLYSCCPADFNGDGFVDDADFVLFAGAYNDLLCP